MGTRLKFLAVAFLLVPSVAGAAGPTVTDWKDSTLDPDAGTPVGTKLNAVHGRSRPNSAVTADSSTEYTVWAVGDGGVILRNRGTTVGWEQVSSPAIGVNLHDVYINPDGNSGWAVGDNGRILRLSSGSWSCVQCPTDCTGCGNLGQPPTSACTCTDLYDIIPLAPMAASSSLFVVGRADASTPDAAYGSGWPIILYFNGTTWTKVTPLTSPFDMDASIAGYYSHDPGLSCEGMFNELEPSNSFTGLMINPLTHISIESTICRMHLQTVSSEWKIGLGRQFTTCTDYIAHYYSSAVVGSVPVIGGDTDCGDLYNTKGSPVKTNLFFYNTGIQKVQALDTGIALTSTLWGTIRGMDFIPTLRWGVGVGWGPGDYMSVTTTGTKAYFVRFDYKNLTRLPAPEDSSSPNMIFYENASYLGTPYNAWPRMNGVFISNYNEAWAVGNDGKTLHWLGPPIMPSSLKASITVFPAGRPVAGQWIDIVLTVTNTGDTTAVSLNPGARLAPLSISQNVPMGQLICGPTCGTISCGSVPACPVDLPARESVSFTWTYSMTGCAPYLDRISASIYAADFVTGNTVSASDFIDLTGDLTAPALQVSVTRSPSGTPIPRDSPIKYLITVRNDGGITPTNLTVWDSVAVPITVTATGQPAGFLAASNPDYAGGRLHYFYNSGPISMTPGTQYTFTLTGIVGRPCTPTTVSNLAGAAGWNLCTDFDAIRGASSQQQFDVPGPPGGVNLVITATRTGGTNPGQPIGYQIVVANGGSAVIENLGLLVTDTVPAVVASATRPPPPTEFFELGPADVPGGTWYAWITKTWTDLSPGETFSFTISGTVGGTCVDVLVSSTPWLSGSNFCQSGTYFIMAGAQQLSAQTDNFLLPGAPPIQFDLSAIQNPANPGPGDGVSFQINVKNVGIPAVNSLTIFDTLPPEIDVIDQDSPPGFSYSYNSGTNFIRWYASGLNMANGDAFTFTITGTIDTVCQTTAVDRSFLIDALSGDCGTTGYFVASATPYVIPVTIDVTKWQTPNPKPGDDIRYEITVSNTGRVAIDGLLVVDTVPAEVMPPVVDPRLSPFTATRTGWPTGNIVVWTATNLNLLPGSSTRFGFSGKVGLTCQPTDVINSAWAAAAARPISPDTCGYFGTQDATTLSFPIVTAPLDASLSLEVEEQVEGNNLVTVLLTVSNTGAVGSTTTALVPSSEVAIKSAYPQETVKIEGPIPTAYYDSLRSIYEGCSPPCDPQAVTFKWIYRTTSIVPVTFTASVEAGAYTNPANAVVCGISASATTKFSDAGGEGMFALDRNIIKSSVNHVTVSFNVKETGRVRVNVFNSVGQKVRSLFDGYVNRREMFPDAMYSGVKECDARKCPDRLNRCACWDGTNDDGERVASGVYFIRLETRRYVETRKIAVVK